MSRMLWAVILAMALLGNARSQPEESPKTSFTDSLGIQWVYIPGGTFEMGDTFGDGDDDEQPVHTVTLSPYYLSATEVTIAQYDAFCVATGRKNPGYRHLDDALGHSLPIYWISWNDAVAYCEWLSRASGLAVRLPTEAEWEYAARSGGKREKWAGTSSESDLHDYAWLWTRNVQPVGGKRPNGLGLYDMTGNVSEWCADRYRAGYYRTSPALDPQGPSHGVIRVLRGGSVMDDPLSARCAHRNHYYPMNRPGYHGFRLAKTP